ncbi:hypothetical protein Ahy_B09g096075 [Arachis hypogaea]|uniref:Uncharacterized protein n=1 Tax=Arachis hypogaea TaxID=3818 RepID=A0A444XHY5_ARAHY|nr:hypothetical protein Ahy_B09g096075 [Arachis hypogaea]
MQGLLEKVLAVLNGKYKRLEHKAEEKAQALKQIRETVNHRNHIDGSVKLIGTSLFGVPKVKQQFGKQLIAF